MTVMKHMSLQNITEACKGTLYLSGRPTEVCSVALSDEDSALVSTEITGVAIDSRKTLPGYLFVPIRGTKVDGHTFIPQVMEKGALATLSEDELGNVSYPYIKVDSCEQALKDLAAFYRNALDIKVVAVTGSVGKTSTKETIASVLAQKYNVLKTEGNYNNEIGLPLTVFNLREEHEIAVLEIGVDHFGDMDKIAPVSQPDLCVITNIGLAHLENFGDRDGTLREKTTLFNHMKSGGTAILNGDDDKLCTVTSVQGISPVFFGLGAAGTAAETSAETATEAAAETSAAAFDTLSAPLTFNSSAPLSAYATDIEDLGLRGTMCTLHLSPGDIRVHIPVPGSHMVYNALAAACAGIALGLTLDEIRSGIETLKTIAGRTNLIDTGDLLIIDDCYNANPVSMMGSLDILSTAKGRTVAVMGDMFELGTGEQEMHYNCGVHAAAKAIDLICCIGGLSRHAYEGAKANAKSSAVLYFETKQEFLEKLPSIIRKEDTILVKASHSMEFPEIVEILKNMKF